MEYIINVDGKYQHFCGPVPKTGIIVKDWNGCAGDPVEWYNDKGNRYTDEELVSNGIIKDNRGEYYDIEGNSRIVSSIFKDIGEGWRKDRPEVYEKYVEGEWKEVPELKALKEKIESYNSIEKDISVKMIYLQETDWYVVRKQETGEIIPEEITSGRSEAREMISELRESELYKNYDADSVEELWNSISEKY